MEDILKNQIKSNHLPVKPIPQSQYRNNIQQINTPLNTTPTPIQPYIQLPTPQNHFIGPPQSPLPPYDILPHFVHVFPNGSKVPIYPIPLNNHYPNNHYQNQFINQNIANDPIFKQNLIPPPPITIQQPQPITLHQPVPLHIPKSPVGPPPPANTYQNGKYFYNIFSFPLKNIYYIFFK